MADASPSRPKTWSKSRRGQVPTYKYRSIDDVRKLGSNCKEVINIYGVVIDCRPIEKSKGSDFFCILRIVDPSYCQGEGTRVTLFHHDENMLPKVNQWDIIRLHRVRPTSFQQDISLISSRGWSWVSWSAKASIDLDIEDESSSIAKSCTILDEDKDKIKSLRDWLATRSYLNLDQARNASEDCEVRKLSDIKSGSFFNLVCQVTSIVKAKHNFLILKVWDATIPSHKIEPATYTEDVDVRKLEGLENLSDYMVDVSVFDNHVQTVEDTPILLGSFVRFCNLHASPRHHNANSAASDETSELFLHGGIVFNRGVVTLDDDDETVEDLKNAMRGIVFLKNNDSGDDEAIESESRTGEKRKVSSESKGSPSKNAKKQRLAYSETTPKKSTPPSPEAEFVTPPQHVSRVNETFKQSQDTLGLLDGMDSPTRGKRPVVQTSDKATQVEPTETSSNEPSSFHNSEDGNNNFLTDSAESQTTMRCHQKSATVVFGENSPLRITSIRELLAAEVALTQSKLFRVRVKICKYSDPNNIVFHFCPASGLRISAKNDGEKLELSDEAYEFVCAFRKQSGDEGDERTRDVAADSAGDGIVETQWFVVSGDEEETVKVDCYENPDDNSKWETLKMNDNITRKRKSDGQRFVILYREDRDCANNLNEFNTSFNRVIRVCPKEALIGRTIPPIAFQNGIYYYCSPGCVGEISVPSLKEEAHSFNAEHPHLALGSPVLPIIFELKFVLEDDTDAVMVTLKDENAVTFFNGVTPTQYLLNKDGCSDSIPDDLKRITCGSGAENSDPVWAEMVIEKKCRRPLLGNLKPVILYEIVNTRLVI